MHELYQTFGSGDLKANANRAFEMAKSGPVMILSRTQPKVVMVHPDQWNATARELQRMESLIEELEDANFALRAALELADGTEKAIPADIEELERMAGRVPA